ncbi:MAG: 6-carboxytetrahydropterin synthase [Bacteroidota bacterium]
MEIEKKYHFYAAHRNEYLEGKCQNLHGHTYYVHVRLAFTNTDESGVTMLFESIDDIIDPIIASLDHSTLVHEKDIKLIEALDILNSKRLVFPYPSSAENLAKYLFDKISSFNLDVKEIRLQETTTSVVIYP